MELRRGRRAVPFYFIVLLILGSGPIPAQAGDGAALLKKTLQEQRVSFQEAPAFASNSEADNAGEGGGLSLLIRLDTKQTAAAWKGGENPPACILAVPLENADEGFSFGVQTALALVNLAGAAVNREDFSLPARLLIVFMGGSDAAYVRNFSGDENEAANSWALDEYPGGSLLVFLDPGEAPQSLVIQYRTSPDFPRKSGIRAPLSMLKPLTAFCKTRNIPFVLGNKAEAESAKVLDYAGLLETGALYLGGVTNAGGGAPQDAALQPDALAGLLLDFFASLNAPSQDADYHYSVVPLPAGRGFFISESAKAALALIIAGLLLAAVIIFQL
jgi:hypothetical protein